MTRTVSFRFEVITDNRPMHRKSRGARLPGPRRRGPLSHPVQSAGPGSHSVPTPPIQILEFMGWSGHVRKWQEVSRLQGKGKEENDQEQEQEQVDLHYVANLKARRYEQAMGRAAKDKRDIYYRKAKEVGFRARSAFKLLQLDEEFKLLEGVMSPSLRPPRRRRPRPPRPPRPPHPRPPRPRPRPRPRPPRPRPRPRPRPPRPCPRPRRPPLPSLIAWPTDHTSLTAYAAPGSWSQVISRQLSDRREQSKIVAVDLQEMAPIEGVTLVQGDITSSVVADKIVQLFDGQKAGQLELTRRAAVLMLGALYQLLLSALNITTVLLRPGGSFVAKIFRGKDVTLLYSQVAEQCDDFGR
eukprot:768036-Hanusia_phi.AAC.4